MLALLGLIVIYIFSLIAFATFRATFDPAEDELFCSTLYECTLTVLRYGLVGDIYDVSTILFLPLLCCTRRIEQITNMRIY